MKYLLLIIAVTFGCSLSAQSTNKKLLDYFNAHGGGACITPYDTFVKYGSNSIGKDSKFIITEDAAEQIVREAQYRGGGKAFDIAYIDSQLGTSYPVTGRLIRFHIPEATLEALNLRLPTGKEYGANSMFVPGGRIKSGYNEGVVNAIPVDMTADIPNYFGDTTKWEILQPWLKDTVKTTGPRKAQKAVGAAKEGACDLHEVSSYQFLLALLPLLLFGGLFLMIWIHLLRDNLKNIKEALSENIDSKITKPNPEYNTDNITRILKEMRGQNSSNSPADMANLLLVLPPTIEVSITDEKGNTSRLSISRVIAFMSAILLLAIGVALSCFYIYYYLRCNTSPDIAHLSTLLADLGLGMAPYTVNKITSALKNKN